MGLDGEWEGGVMYSSSNTRPAGEPVARGLDVRGAHQELRRQRRHARLLLLQPEGEMLQKPEESVRVSGLGVIRSLKGKCYRSPKGKCYRI